jgi:archaellum component FlaC
LTVRIGADTSSLQKALTGINHAVNATQSQLTRIQRALRGLDDTSGAAAQAHQLELVGQAAQEVSTRLASLRRAYDEVGRQTVTVGDLTGSMSDVSETIGDAAARTGQLRDQLNGITAELKQTYEAIRTSEGTLGADLADDRIVKSVDAINQAMKETGREYREFTKETVNTGAVVDEFERLGLITQETADHIRTLRERYNDLSAEREQMRQVESFQDLGVKIAEDTALLERLQSKMRELQSVSTVARGLDTQAEELRVISTAADAAAQRFRELDAAAKLDPSNVALAEERSQALAEATHLAAERAEALRQHMAQYASAGIDKAASETESVALRLATAESNAAKFTSQLQEAVGRAQSISNEMAVIEARDDGLGEGAEQAAEDYRKLETQLEQVNAEIAELRTKAQSALEELDTAKACAELERLETEMREAEAASHGLGNTTKSAFGDGVSVIIDISQYARQAAGYIVRASEEIDGAYRDMRKTVNGTEADFEHLRQAAMDYSQTHFTSADTILEMEAMGGQLGIATSALERFAETAANLDIATNIDADTIAQQMGQLANIMDDLNEDNLDAYADALVRLGNNMPALENDIAEITTRIAAQSNIIGMSTPEVLGWSTALASSGQKSEAAGTAFSKTISQIEAAVGGGTTAIADLAEATDQSVDDVLRIVSEGGPAFEDLAAAAGTSTDEIAASMENGKGKLEDFARVARMSAEDFARMWRESPSDALKAFIEGLKAVQDAGGSMDNTLAELGITATRQKQGLEGLTQTTDKLNDALQMSGDAWNGVSDQWGDAGDAAREAQRKSEGFSGTLEKLSNNAQVLAASFGEGMVPLMEGLSGAVGGLADAFQTMPPAVSSTIASLGALATGISVFYPIVRGVKHSWGEMKDAIGGTVGKLANSSAMFRDLSSAAGDSMSKLGALAASAPMATAGIGALATAAAVVGYNFYDAWQKSARFDEAINTINGSASKSITALSNAQSSLTGVGDAAGMSKDEILQFTEALAGNAQSTQDMLAKTGTSIATLRDAVGTIEEFAGRSDLGAEQQGKLSAAIEKVNQQLGLSIDANDVLAQSYVDQDGTAHNLIQTLHELTDARIAEMKQSAYSGAYKQAMEDRIKAQQEYGKVAQEQEQKIQEIMSKTPGLTYEQARAMTTNQEALGGYGKKYEEIQKNIDATAASERAYQIALGDTEVAMSANASEMQKLLGLDLEGKFGLFTQQLNLAGQSSTELAAKLDTLHVSTEDMVNLASTDEGIAKLQELGATYDGTYGSLVSWLSQAGIGFDEIALKTNAFIESFRALPEETQNSFNGVYGGIENLIGELGNLGYSMDTISSKGISADQLAQWAIESQGNIQYVIDRINEYNQTPMEPQTAEVDTDKASEKVGTLADDLRTKLDGKTYSAKATLSASGTSEVLNATGAMKDFGLLPTTTQKKAEAKTEGAGKVDGLRGEFEKYSQLEEPTKTATAESYGEDGVWGLNSALDAFDAQPSYVSKTRETFVVTTTKSAAGGIRMHAEGGYIATGPTYMTPRDLVGEAGAEAIVPLTNRRYSGAFARVIAEEIGKLGTQSAGNVFNVTLNAYGNDNPERFARQSMRSMMQLARAEG